VVLSGLPRAIDSLGAQIMPIHQTPAQRRTVERVIHEFKHGELQTARARRKVKNPKQAVAIALSEAGASKYDTPKERAHNLRHTKAKERRGETGQAAAEGPRRAGGRGSARRAASFITKPSVATSRGARR
jgi:Family of unknown function (DUF6496)